LKNYKDFFNLFILLFISAVIIYFTPKFVSSAAALTLLFFAWKSKKDYFWLAFFILIEDQPGGLFAGGMADADYRIPLYTLLKGASFTITELYYILMVFKARKIEKKLRKSLKPFFSNWIQAFATLLVLLILISPVMGMDFTSMRYAFKVLVQFTLFYSIFRLISTKEELVLFLKTLVPFAIAAVSFQLFSIATKQQIAQLLNPAAGLTQGVLSLNEQTGILERPIEMVSIIFICFTGGLFLLYYRRHSLSQNLLIFLITSSFISIIMTATRSWFVGFAAGAAVYFIMREKSLNRVFRFGAVVMAIVILTSLYTPVLIDQIENAWDRIETLEYIVKGDITAAGTIKRYDVRAPAVIQAFNKSTIILGAGFSDLHFTKNDGHVGYHNLLFNAGIAGFIMVILFIVYLFKVGFSAYQQNNIPYNRVIFISLTALIVLLVVNTGTQTIGFNTSSLSRNFLQAYTLLLVNISYLIYKEEKFKEFNKKAERSS